MNSNVFSFLTPAWLADVSLQAALWLSLAGLACWWPGLSAARRHFIQAGALLMLPVMLAASLCMPGWRLMGSSAVSPAPLNLSAADSPASAAADPFAAAPVLAVSMKVKETDASWAVVLWGAGVAAGLGLLMCAGVALRRMRRDSDVVAEGLARRCFREEAADFGLRLPDDCLRVSKGCRVPMTWGLFTTKTVLLPEAALEWPEERLRLVLRHELAHLARADMAVSALATFAAVLLWFHPGAWLMLRSARRSREEACDDLALQRGTQSAADFARELLAAVACLGELPRRPLLPLALAMSFSAGVRGLRSRLENILRGPSRRDGFLRPQKIALLLPAFAITAVLAGLTACREKATHGVAEKRALVLVRSRVLSIPVDSPALAKAGLLPDSTTLQSLGNISNEALQKLLSGLAQQKGVDLVSAPSVTTISGQKATVEVVREFIYPTEFDPPKLAANNQMVPTTPTAFEMRPVGLRIDLLPRLLSDDEVELTVTPEVTSFQGFVEYGASIEHVDAAGQKISQPNSVKQPVFHSAKTTTSFVLKRGEAAVLGGLGAPDTPLNASKPDLDRVADLRAAKSERLIFFIIEAEKIADTPAPLVPSKPKPAAKAPGLTVTIFGFVHRQGKYDLEVGAPLGDLLERVGGFSSRADTQIGELERQGRKQPLDLQNTSLPMQDGDVVIVQEKQD
ncbi:MAG: hypothetical protein JNM65_17645 [Verrucomicrobiaceae bacterium]|nr:hypothetical protein [Verrucomicrobiaceae bacterium]